jgi:hypothetical protein
MYCRATAAVWSVQNRTGQAPKGSRAARAAEGELRVDAAPSRAQKTSRPAPPACAAIARLVSGLRRTAMKALRAVLMSANMTVAADRHPQ